MTKTFSLLVLTTLCVVGLFYWADWTGWRAGVDLDRINQRESAARKAEADAWMKPHEETLEGQCDPHNW